MGSKAREFPHSDFLEGESFASPLPTVASLPASPSRTPSCDQGGHPPWNPSALLRKPGKFAYFLGSLPASRIPARSPPDDLLAHTHRLSLS